MPYFQFSKNFEDLRTITMINVFVVNNCYNTKLDSKVKIMLAFNRLFPNFYSIN